ncbi:MAG: hypothetical protein DLM69_02825 [Candidatus Chloroheliales bacterium]|nr:MAG: hypothetical protein DLM69_02825 [Chloroflexota bacterium]
MYRSNRLALLLSIAVLVASAALLSGCRLGCAENDIPCKTGISATFTVPVPPTSTPLPPATNPTQVVQAFITIYSSTDTNQFTSLAGLFDSAYAKIPPTAIACSALNTKSNYGGITTSTLKDPVITGTVSLVVASIIGVSRSGDVSFNLKQEGVGGWKIDSITGWIGGDISPDRPVGDSQSCLQVTPESGATPGTGAVTPGATTPGADTPTPGAGGASTSPTPLSAA